MTSPIVQAVYRVAFEPHFLWWTAAIGLVGVVAGLGMVYLARRKLFGWFIFAFSAIWVVQVFLGATRTYSTLSRALRDPKTPVVEGIVEDFVAEPVDDHQDESFRVGTVRFSYSSSSITGGYNTTRPKGGPIHAGLQVRIHYVQSFQGPLIVRLEIAE